MILCERRNHKRTIVCLEQNDNENRAHQHLQDAAKAVLRGKCTDLNSYIRNEEGGVP